MAVIKWKTPIGNKPRLLIVVLVLLLSLSWLGFLVHLAPEGTGQQHIRFPSSLEELKTVSNALQAYMEEASAYVGVLFISAYLFKQTFAVPGSVFLNVLAGALFGLPVGFVICCTLTACGASFCYLLAK